MRFYIFGNTYATHVREATFYRIVFFCGLVATDLAVVNSSTNVQSFFFCILHSKPPVHFRVIYVQ